MERYRESADMCKRAHDRYTVVMTKAETLMFGHLIATGKLYYYTISSTLRN